VDRACQIQENYAGSKSMSDKVQWAMALHDFFGARGDLLTVTQNAQAARSRFSSQLEKSKGGEPLKKKNSTGVIVAPVETTYSKALSETNTSIRTAQYWQAFISRMPSSTLGMHRFRQRQCK
jgi:hypothetical protein